MSVNVRLGYPIELTAIEDGALFCFGGFIFKIPEKYTNIKCNGGVVVAYNNKSQMVLGKFKTGEIDAMEIK